MPPKNSKACKAAFGLTNAEYKLLCGIIVNAQTVEYDLPSVTKYMGSISETSTKNRVRMLWKKIRQDAYDIGDEMDAKANKAIQDAAAAPAPASNVNPRKRAREDSEFGNDNRSVNNRHNPGFSSSSLSARIPELRLRQQQYKRRYQQQHQYKQQHQKLHQIPVTSRTPSATDTRGLRESSVPAGNQKYETPPPPYTRLTTAGPGVITPAPVINSNNAVNQGVDMGMGLGSLSGAQMFGAEGLGNGFGYGLDGDGFPLGINQVGNGPTFGAPAGPAPMAYPSDARNGFGLPNNNGINGSSISNHPNNGYMGNNNGVNGGAMGFALPNDLDYNLSVDSATFYDNNLRLKDALVGAMDIDLANGFNGISGNTINGAAVEYGLQNNFFHPPVNHITGRNSNRVPQNVPIATVPRPVQPVFQPVFQPAQNVRALNHQNVNLGLDFLGENGNVNENTATAAQPNGVQPELALPILEKLPVPVPAAESTPARLPTPAPTPATAEDAFTAMLQQQPELQQRELEQEQEQQPPQGKIDPWDAPFLQEQEQLPQGEFDSVEAQLFSALTAEGYGLGLSDL